MKKDKLYKQIAVHKSTISQNFFAFFELYRIIKYGSIETK